MDTVIRLHNFDFQINEDSREAVVVGHCQGGFGLREESPLETLLRIGTFRERFLRVDIPETILYNDEEFTVSGIADNAFAYDYSLVEVFVPKTVRSIGDKAFDACHYLEIVHLSDGLLDIGEYSFCWCENLRAIEIPDTVNSIGRCAFRMCHSLTSVKLSKSLSIIPDNAFSECTKLLQIDLPDSVNIISKSAFYACRNLENIGLSKNLEYIEEEAFEYCSIKELCFPESLKKICDHSFGENELKYVSFKNGNTEIHPDAFYPNYNIKRIVIPSDSKDYYAEQLQCYKDVLMAEDECIIYNTDEFVFYLYQGKRQAVVAECISCEYYVVVPEKVVYKDVAYVVVDIKTDNSFRDCGHIKLPNTITQVNERMFACCLIESIDLPDSIVEIGDYSFYGCPYLCEIVIPNNVTKIGNRAFEDCCDLETVVLPKSIKHIGQHVFCDCESLERIEIPKGYLNYFEELMPKYKNLLYER